ncbi:MAG: hypothetical protein ABI068_09565 [Ktedonobacterales bacterium]
MSPQTTVRLSIGDALAIVTGLSPELAARLHDLMRPFVATSDAMPDGATDATPDAAHEALSNAVNIQVNAVADDAEDEDEDEHENIHEPRGTRWIVRLRGEELCSHTQADELLKYLEWLAIAESLVATQRYAVFHSAALTCAAATVMLVGPSGAGKSTLTLHLIQRGWRPLGDDTALMDTESGRLYPFPRCFHVEPAWSAQASAHADFEWPAGLVGYARPLHWATGGHTISAIFLIERDATSGSTCAPIPQAQAAGALLVQAIRTQLAPAQIAQAAVRLAAGARCYQLTNGDLDGALDLIATHSSLK